MWYACAIATNADPDDLQLKLPVDLSSGLRLERIPDWVKTDDALKLLSWKDREQIRASSLAIVSEYESSALGDPDPTWTGKSPRSIQATVDEKFALLGLAAWLSRPSSLSGRQVLHFGRKGEADSLRRYSTLRPVLVTDNEHDTPLGAEDLSRAAELLKQILALPRRATTWTAVKMLDRALTESRWEERYLLQWIVLESLFGPSSPGETVHRLGSCPVTWCRSAGVKALSGRKGRQSQAGTAPSLRWRSSPRGAMVSRVM
jgi:hypothetical protein